MGKPTGFIEIKRAKPQARPIQERLRDWQEVYLPEPEAKMRDQGARCMDCGIPFCHQGCPLGNLIPDWNDLVYRQRWQAASDRLHATNNFPELTGRLVPGAVRRLLRARHQRRSGHDQVDRAVDRRARVRARLDSGAAAGASAPASAWRSSARVRPASRLPTQLNKAGHHVTVFERADRIGGLLRYGIPEFKLEKRFIDRRLALMSEEGVEFRTGVEIGIDLPVAGLRRQFDAIVLCCGDDLGARSAGSRPRARRRALRGRVPDAAESPLARAITCRRPKPSPPRASAS